MITTVMHMKLSKKIILLIFIIIISISTSCDSKHKKILKEESTIETIKEKSPNNYNNKNEKDTFYRHRDEIISLIEKEKIFNINVDSNSTDKDIYMYVTLKSEKTILKNLDKIMIRLSVHEFNDELSTNISKLDKSKRYWEIKLNEGKLEEVYDVNISKESNLLTNKDKELIMSKNKSTILRFDIFVDEQNPIKIYNHFLN